MRAVLAIVALLLLPGCLGNATEQGQQPADEGDRQRPTPESSLAGNGTLSTTIHAGHLTWAVTPPLSPVAPGPHERFDSTVVRVDVPEDVAFVHLELVWEDGPATRPALALRTVSETDKYQYGGGSGTPTEPASVTIDRPESWYDVTAFAELAEVEVGWTLYATLFRGDGVPAGFTAVQP